MDALYNNTAGDSPDGKTGNLTRSAVEFALTDGSGPNLKYAKNPNGGVYGKAPNGHYDPKTNTITINESRLDDLEKTLSSNSTIEDKQAVLLGVFMGILHELGHYGDYLDGLKQEGELGFGIEMDVWWLQGVKPNVYEDTNSDKYDPETQKTLIKSRADKSIFPTVLQLINYIPKSPTSTKPTTDCKCDKKSSNEVIEQ